jgi:hypothetical protein
VVKRPCGLPHHGLCTPHTQQGQDIVFTRYSQYGKAKQVSQLVSCGAPSTCSFNLADWALDAVYRTI